LSPSTPRRVAAAMLVAACACVVVPAAASAKPEDLKVMVRNVYLGADLIPLAAAPNRDAFEQAAAQRFATVQSNDFATRAKSLAAEIAKNKPDLVGVQEAAIWRRGADGVKDGATTPATQVVYDSTALLLKELASRGARHQVQGGGRPRLVRLRGPDRARLRPPHHPAQRDPRARRLEGEGRAQVQRAVP
jgi:hypothetical protein